MEHVRQLNEHLYKMVICKYAPNHEGPLYPLSIAEIYTLQSMEHRADAWRIIHLHWQGYNLIILSILEKLIKSIKKYRSPSTGMKGHLIRKLYYLKGYYNWKVDAKNRKVRRKRFLKETGLGEYFYRMHLAGLSYQI